MNDYCLLLNTDIPPLIPGVDITAQRSHHQLLTMDQVNPEMLAWLDSMDMITSFAEVFHWAPGESGGIHVDNHEGDFVKLNWVYGGSGSSTTWYHKLDLSPKAPLKTVVNTDYFLYTPKELVKVHSQNVAGPCVMQVGIPHQVINSNLEHRHTLCFVPKFRDGSNISMKEAQEIFAPYVKN